MTAVPMFAGPRWKLQGLCTQSDPERWFPNKDGDPTGDQNRRAGDEVGKPGMSAKAICKRCPVVNECLTWALEMKEKHGIWGGMTVKERNALMKRQP
jgi:WhiB family redox-sensing transcriptional regulator